MKHMPRLVPPVLTALLVAALAACGPGPNPPAQLGALDPLEVNLSAQTDRTATASFSFINTGGSALEYTVSVPNDAPWLKITVGASATVPPNQTQTVTLEGECPASPGKLNTNVTVQGVGDASSLSGQVKVTLTCTAPPSPPSPPPAPPAPPPTPPTPPTPPPPAPDTTPDAFSFTARKDAPPSTDITSDEITIKGIDAPSPVTVSGGTLILNGADSSATTVKAGDRVAVRLTSSQDFEASVSATVTIGGVSGAFTATTIKQPDTTPDPFSFAPQKDVAPNTTITSNEITVTGIDAPTTLAFDGNTTNTQPTLLVNGKISNGAAVKNGDRIALRLTSSGTPGATVTATLILDVIGGKGGVRGSFSVTTINPPTLSGYKDIVATQNGPISVRPTVTGGTAPFQFSISPSLPVSLSLDPATGAISGPPNNPQATTSFEVTVTDASGLLAKTSFNLTVNPQTRFQTGYPDIVARFSVNVVTQGVPVVSGGTAPLSFKIAPDLTANTGLLFDAKTGKISGAPTRLSPKTRYQVAVTDANGRSDITEFNLEVRPLVTAVFISPSSAEISVGQVLPLSSAIRTDGPASFGVTWTSSEPCRARVDQNGSVTGVSGGSFTATITATSKDNPSIKGVAAVTVVGPQTVPIGSGC